MPNKTDMSSEHSLLLSSGNRDDVSRHRPSSEPCAAAATADPCFHKSDAQTLGANAFGSVKLLSQTNARSDRAEVTSTTNNLDTASSTIKHESVSALHRLADDKLSNSVLSAQIGSVWRRVKPHGSADRSLPVTANVSATSSSIKSVVPSLQPADDAFGFSHVTSTSAAHDDVCMTEVCSEQQRIRISSAKTGLNVEQRANMVDSHVNGVIDTLGLVNDDKDCLLVSHVDDDDSDEASRNETSGYDLSDNNAVVTTHQLRDDIPDSELIDYSDDGGESLTADSSNSASVKEQQLMHVYIALFDYDPATMSPNPDAVESELPFSEGQLIKVGYP